MTSRSDLDWVELGKQLSAAIDLEGNALLALAYRNTELHGYQPVFAAKKALQEARLVRAAINGKILEYNKLR